MSAAVSSSHRSRHRLAVVRGRAAAILLAVAVVPGAASAVAGDWPQILGPNRNGVAVADERLADRWPEGGPRVVWRRQVGAGHAGVAVSEG